jgi:fructose-bisphosphate aldolase, class I
MMSVHAVQQSSEASLSATAQALVAHHKGLLAMDESEATCHKRFASVSIAQTEEYRRAWRELLATTPRLNECINGAILVDETLHQSTASGVPFGKQAALFCIFGRTVRAMGGGILARHGKRPANPSMQATGTLPRLLF